RSAGRGRRRAGRAPPSCWTLCGRRIRRGPRQSVGSLPIQLRIVGTAGIGCRAGRYSPAWPGPQPLPRRDLLGGQPPDERLGQPIVIGGLVVALSRDPDEGRRLLSL